MLSGSNGKNTAKRIFSGVFTTNWSYDLCDITQVSRDTFTKSWIFHFSGRCNEVLLAKKEFTLEQNKFMRKSKLDYELCFFK